MAAENDLLTETKEASQRRARAHLERDRIIQAALDLIDREGPSAFSMRRVAETLGAGTMSAYRHVEDREELLALVIDVAMAEMDDVPIDAPSRFPTGSWEERACAYCRTFYMAMARHRNLSVLAIESRGGPRLLRWKEELFQIFRDAGFSDEDSYLAYEAVLSVLFGCLYSDIRTMVGRGAAALDANTYPNIRLWAEKRDQSVPFVRFDFALRLMIDGLSATLKAGPSKS